MDVLLAVLQLCVGVAMEEGRRQIQTLVVSGSFQIYHNEVVSNKLSGVGRLESVLEVTVNLLMCDRGSVLYSVHIILKLIPFPHKPATP